MLFISLQSWTQFFLFGPASFSLTLEEKTAEGETFLTLAVKAGLVENVKLLLENGASPHTRNGKKESPLLLGQSASTSSFTEDSSICTLLYLLTHLSGAFIQSDLQGGDTNTYHSASVNSELLP